VSCICADHFSLHRTTDVKVSSALPSAPESSPLLSTPSSCSFPFFSFSPPFVPLTLCPFTAPTRPNARTTALRPPGLASVASTKSGQSACSSPAMLRTASTDSACPATEATSSHDSLLFISRLFPLIPRRRFFWCPFFKSESSFHPRSCCSAVASHALRCCAKSRETRRKEQQKAVNGGKRSSSVKKRKGKYCFARSSKRPETQRKKPLHRLPIGQAHQNGLMSEGGKRRRVSFDRTRQGRKRKGKEGRRTPRFGYASLNTGVRALSVSRYNGRVVLVDRVVEELESEGAFVPLLSVG
jgi:hypothetical protein